MVNVTSSDSVSFPLVQEQAAIWIVACVGLSLSWAALWVIQQQLDAHKQLDFEWVAHNRTRALDHGLQRGLEAVTSIHDLFLASEDVGREDFHVFAQALLRRHQGIHTLMWVPRVSHAERQRFEQIVSADIPNFQFVDRGPHFSPVRADRRDTYFPILFAEAYRDNAATPGFDLGSDPELKEVLVRARETDGMAVGGRILLIEHNQDGFMAALPVYAKGLPIETAMQRRQNLLGFAVGLFRIGDLTHAAFEILEPRGVDVLIQDQSAPEEGRFLHSYSSRVSPSSESGAADKEPQGQDLPQITALLEVADRKWLVTCVQTPQFRSVEAFEESPWVVLVAGLLFTLLLSFYLVRIKENMAERVRMDRVLIEREELFRQMTETVDEMFWAANYDLSRVLYLSPRYEKIWGVSLEEMDGNPGVFFGAIPPDDQDLLVKAIRRIRQKNVDIEVIHRIVRPDETIRWVRTRGFPVMNRAGQLFRLVGFVEDITEKKLAEEALRESESQLRTVFNQSPDIIMTVDREGQVLMMNRSTPDMPAEEAVGRSSVPLLPVEFHKWYAKALKKVFNKGKIKHFEYSTADAKYWAGRIVPIRADGPVTAAMVIASDITERRTIESQALSNARLASIGVLSAGVAHEINNPNNSITFNAAILGRGWQDVMPILEHYFAENGDFSVGGIDFSEAREMFPQLLSGITENSARIKRIVENLKHMARQDKGMLNEMVDVPAVLEEARMVLHNQIQRHTDTCIFEVKDELPPVRGNTQQLEQVFINLVLNALQALPDRDHGVFVQALVGPLGECIAVVVRDEGNGISERDLGRITEPFFTTRTETGGTGLGLSISCTIIERHGGQMDFESKLGEGTKVTIKLPLNSPCRSEENPP
ncbi:MAG: PAS domain S-box protein [Gammaproteobacteria bacterium]|nr:PAS domain S-box protein [Gammaproteobacteria bacterium]